MTKKKVLIQHISTHFMVADPFTKVITQNIYLAHTKSFGLRRFKAILDEILFISFWIL